MSVDYAASVLNAVEEVEARFAAAERRCCERYTRLLSLKADRVELRDLVEAAVEHLLSERDSAPRPWAGRDGAESSPSGSSLSWPSSESEAGRLAELEGRVSALETEVRSLEPSPPPSPQAQRARRRAVLLLHAARGARERP